MGTILVPHSAHYRGMSPPVQAAAAGGLQIITKPDDVQTKTAAA
jgi:hypothetical protein